MWTVRLNEDDYQLLLAFRSLDPRHETLTYYNNDVYVILFETLSVSLAASGEELDRLITEYLEKIPKGLGAIARQTTEKVDQFTYEITIAVLAPIKLNQKISTKDIRKSVDHETFLYDEED